MGLLAGRKPKHQSSHMERFRSLSRGGTTRRNTGTRFVNATNSFFHFPQPQSIDMSGAASACRRVAALPGGPPSRLRAMPRSSTPGTTSRRIHAQPRTTISTPLLSSSSTVKHHALDMRIVQAIVTKNTPLSSILDSKRSMSTANESNGSVTGKSRQQPFFFLPRPRSTTYGVQTERKLQPHTLIVVVFFLSKIDFYTRTLGGVQCPYCLRILEG